MPRTTLGALAAVSVLAASAFLASCASVDEPVDGTAVASSAPSAPSVTSNTSASNTTSTPASGHAAERALTFIAEGDSGASGTPIGCGDSAVPVPFTTTTIAPLSEVMRAQVAVRDDHYGRSGLYNALHQSDLDFVTAAIDDGHATVELTGTLLVGGVCDIPRVREQLTEPALQFDNVDTVTVLIDGVPLDDLLSLHG